jgi:hypothetical protein
MRPCCAWAAGGHQVTDVDLHAEDFDPVMSRQDRFDYLNTTRNISPVGIGNSAGSSTVYGLA